MMFESREEELARKLAAKEREDTDRAIVQLIKGMDVTYEKVAEVLEVPLARVLAGWHYYRFIVCNNGTRINYLKP